MEKKRIPLRPTQEWAMEKRKARRFLWVDLNDGTSVCVWAPSVGDALTVMGAAIRPPELRDLGEVDEQEAMIAQIMTCCYDDEPPHGARTFADHMAWAIRELDRDEFNRINKAFSEVSNTDAQSLESTRAFTPRTEAIQLVG
jgi:fermentation-respiration switch protein FrsA (DUF1100 family)